MVFNFRSNLQCKEKKECEKELVNAMYSSLATAEDLRLSSIWFSAVSQDYTNILLKTPSKQRLQQLTNILRITEEKLTLYVSSDTMTKW